MTALWPLAGGAFFHHIENMSYGEEPGPCPDELKVDEDDQGGQRAQKRQRRSIFFSEADSDSDASDDAEDASLVALNGLRPDSLRCELAVVPATPFSANTLSKGACLLTPSFPRRSSSPCLASTSAFVAVHEEANAGFRSYMEDRSAAMTADGVAYLGVYDGHGGTDASTFLQRHLLPTIQAHLLPGCDVHDALTAAYANANAAFRATGSIQGSTATTIILKNRRLIAANVGDSPAFVVKKSGEVYSVIQEHKIEGEEAARIAAQGVPIYRSPTGPAYMGTPDGTRWLNMSRAFGDFVYPAISCEPHVCSLDVSDGKYLVIGSDGLTEKWPVAEAAQYVTQLAAAGWSLAAICRCLVARALSRGSTDNISCMVVDLEVYLAHAEGQEVAAETEEEALMGPGSSGGAAPEQGAEATLTGTEVLVAAGVEPLRHSPDDELAPEAAQQEYQQWQLRQQQQSGCAKALEQAQQQQGLGTPPSRGESEEQLVCQETPCEEQGRSCGMSSELQPLPLMTLHAQAQAVFSAEAAAAPSSGSDGSAASTSTTVTVQGELGAASEAGSSPSASGGVEEPSVVSTPEPEAASAADAGAQGASKMLGS